MPVDVADRAEKARADYRALQERINADADLSPEGKQRQLADAERTMSETLTALREEADAERAGTIARLRDKAFGPPTIGSSAYERAALRAEFSRALDRAEAVKNGRDAADLMRRSLEVGDELLARALARVAYDRSYRSALDHYVDTFPEMGDTFRELDAAIRDDADIGQVVRRSLMFSGAA